MIRKRMLEDEIRDWLQIHPAVMIYGARLVGKTTLAKRLANSTISLESGEELRSLADDIEGGLLSRPEPILIDEWGRLPDVMATIKRLVDQIDSPNNRFILTGSWTPELKNLVQTAPGRVMKFRLYPMTVAERKGILTTPLFDRILAGVELQPSSDETDLTEYLHWAVCGGYPETMNKDEHQSRLYIRNYLNDLLMRDVTQVTKQGVRESSFKLYIQAYAAHTLTSSAHSNILDDVQVSYPTGDRYAKILKHLFLTEELDPWRSNQIKRLAKTPRRVMVDSSLLAAIMGWNSRNLLDSGTAKGKIIETFVISQLLAEAQVSKVMPRLYFFKEHRGGREIDLLAKIDGHWLIGIEIKSGVGPSSRDAKHLAWFRDQFPKRFIAGVVLHMGKLAYSLGEKLWAVPISTLWSGQQ